MLQTFMYSKYIQVSILFLGIYIFNTSFFLAKKTLYETSKCNPNYVNFLLKDILKLSSNELDYLSNENLIDKGCWMPELTPKVGIIVVDALRFDFAISLLPKSIGSRISYKNSTRSKLFKFVADPPTVTSQRLKALTTGGLPTFIDIFKNFGGMNSLMEDSWIHQAQSKNIVFVGDDTWLDIYDKSYFKEAYPFPSFNTRDLDTVDNGCLYYLPKFLPSLGNGGKQDIVIMHFLGVDHVGHTYGPNDVHMKEKLSMIDEALSTILDTIDDARKCHGVFIFGDHGMTEDGNHGGGSYDETHAALFSHFSPGCNANTFFDNNQETIDVFHSIHQIDLVPTISILLGLPIPYSNLGSIIPSILPTSSLSYIATSLALNTAQVWNYLLNYNNVAHTFSETQMNQLEQYLNDAVAFYKLAMLNKENYKGACVQFKYFLNHVFELGISTWTTFNMRGIVIGINLILFILIWKFVEIVHPIQYSTRSNALEIGITSIFIVFSCVVLSFSNSYILSEQQIVMFLLAILSILLTYNGIKAYLSSINNIQNYCHCFQPLVIAVLARMHEIFISGHGVDISLHLHTSHHFLVFIPSLIGLALLVLNYNPFHTNLTSNNKKWILVSLAFLGVSWWCKYYEYDISTNRITQSTSFLAFIIPFLHCIFYILSKFQNLNRQGYSPFIFCFNFLMIVMITTGPSSAPSALIFWMQFICFSFVIQYPLLLHNFNPVSDVTLAFLWRLITRHAFYATNHACFFESVQFSSAFIFTTQFNFYISGFLLFVNTFGWDILGSLMVLYISIERKTLRIWKWFCWFQLCESCISCISVSVLRRHLMVWSIFAPRFVYSVIFLFLNVGICVVFDCF